MKIKIYEIINYKFVTKKNMGYNNKLIIGLLLGIIVSQSPYSQAVQLTSQSHSHLQLHDEGDQDEEVKKVDEVDALMDKYDNEEKHEAYLKSPEYKKA